MKSIVVSRESNWRSPAAESRETRIFNVSSSPDVSRGNKIMRNCLLIVTFGLLLGSAPPARADFISQVLSDNPRGFWILNDAGPTAADSSVNGFNGTYGTGVTPQGIAGPSWVPPSGLVADFTGGTISFPAPLDLGANGYTIEAWINPTLSSLQNTTRIVASGVGFDGYGFGTAANGELVFTSFTEKDYETKTLTLLPNQWYYVGVVLDANNDAKRFAATPKEGQPLGLALVSKLRGCRAVWCGPMVLRPPVLPEGTAFRPPPRLTHMVPPSFPRR